MQKRFREFLAVSLAITMICPAGAFAAPIQDLNTSTTVEGVSTTEYINVNDYYEVCLPTESALRFHLDPQGLAGLGAGESATLESLSGNSGRIMGTTSACIINQSARPIGVSVSMSATVKASGDVKLVTDPSSVSADTLNNILLYAVPCKNSVTISANYATASQGFILRQEPKVTPNLMAGEADTMKFVLEKTEYTVSRNHTGTLSYFRTGAGNGTGVMLGGLVNSRASWTDFTNGTKKVGFTSLFSFYPVSGTAVPDAQTAYGFLSATDKTGSNLERIDAVQAGMVEIEVERIAGSRANSVVTLAKSTLSSVRYVECNGSARDVLLTSGINYNYSGSSMALLGTYLRSFRAGVFKFEVQYSDHSKQIIKVTIR